MPGNNSLSIVGVFIIAFAAQRVAIITVEYITLYGLNGRLDLLLLFIATFFAVKLISDGLDGYIDRVNSNAKRNTLNGRNTKAKIQMFSVIKYLIIIRRIVKDLSEFSVLYLSTLMTLYIENYIRIFLSMWAVSTATSTMMIICAIIFLISLKAEFFGDPQDLRYENTLYM